jgi:hypothetical protein
VLDPSHCTAQGKNKGAAEIKNDQQRIHNDLFVDDQLGYGDSQA